MHGNVAEWTCSLYAPYPYDAKDGRDDASAPGRRVARGGSWRDRPYRSTSSFRLDYKPFQEVYNVGFRVLVAPNSKPIVAAMAATHAPGSASPSAT